MISAYFLLDLPSTRFTFYSIMPPLLNGYSSMTKVGFRLGKTSSLIVGCPFSS